MGHDRLFIRRTFRAPADDLPCIYFLDVSQPPIEAIVRASVYF
jgi:hypothetical protein